jgi:multiple sugar transport system permease protein
MATTQTTVPSVITRSAPRTTLLTRKQSEMLVRIVSFVVLFIGAITMVAPFLWMVATSLKRPMDVFSIPPNFIPNPVDVTNYSKVFEQTDMLRGFINSLIIALTSTAGEVFFSLLAGFAFARLKFPGRGVFFSLLLATMSIPAIVTLVPSFILFRTLGWVDTWLPLIVPPMLGTAYAVFLSRQFMATLPNELIDAAKVDGANYFQTFLFIFVPLARPIMLTLAVLGFIARWNDFLGPTIYIPGNVEMYTVQQMLARLFGSYSQQWSIMMAGAVLVVLPCILLFFFMQRYFIEGVALTGLKG